MSSVDAIIELHPWLALPPGQALLAWEQARLDARVADIFGFHALQLGLPEIDGLRANRMPHRWTALDGAYQDWTGQGLGDPSHLRCDFECLPFSSSSLDLVVMPHALELARDPHHTLREVGRVLVPEGRVVICGFNPMSLWGLSQRAARWREGASSILPAGEFIGYWRLRDWLRLLDLELETSEFGMYRPHWRHAGGWSKLEWMEKLGHRWWPVLGAAYFVVAVKRSRGMHLVGKLNRKPLRRKAAAAVVANRQVREGQE